ncbi:MAG: hypothetical protein NZ761_06325, partial [Dehalococcoidia bacterium]|nr:hypothetical protein [Dehalococcoidia bacterium]
MRSALLRVLAMLGLLLTGLGPVIGGLQAANEAVVDLNIGPCVRVHLELVLTGLPEGAEIPTGWIEVDGVPKQLNGVPERGGAVRYPFSHEANRSFTIGRAVIVVPDGWSGSLTVDRADCVPPADREEETKGDSEKSDEPTNESGDAGPTQGDEGSPPGGEQGGSGQDQGASPSDGSGDASDGSAGDGGPFGPPPGPLSDRSDEMPVRFTVWKHFANLFRSPSGTVTFTITNQTTGQSVTVSCNASGPNAWYICGLSAPLGVLPGDILEVSETAPAGWVPYLGVGTFTFTATGPSPNQPLAIPNGSSTMVWQCTRPQEYCGLSVIDVHETPLLRVRKYFYGNVPAGATAEITVNVQETSQSVSGTCVHGGSCPAIDLLLSGGWGSYTVDVSEQVSPLPTNSSGLGTTQLTFPQVPSGGNGGWYCIGSACNLNVGNNYHSDSTPTWWLSLQKRWHDPDGILPNQEATFQVTVTAPDGTVLLHRTCTIRTGNSPFPDTQYNYCWFSLQPPPPAGSTVTVTEVPPAGWTPDRTVITFTIPTTFPASGDGWRCWNEYSCSVEFRNEYRWPRVYTVEWTDPYKNWWDTGVWPSSGSVVTIADDDETIRYDCPPADPNHPGQGLQTPLQCRLQAGSPPALTGVPATGTITIDEPVVPHPWRPVNVPQSRVLRDLNWNCQWLTVDPPRIRCRFVPDEVRNQPFSELAGWIDIYKQWPFVQSSGPATITVTVGGQQFQVVCPFQAGGTWVNCGRIPVPVSVQPGAQYTVQESGLPSSVVVQSGTGTFTWQPQQCWERDVWGRPVCRHNIVNRPNGLVIVVRKEWADPAPGQAPASGPTGVVVTVDGTPYTVTCPGTTTPYGQVNCGTLVVPGGQQNATLTVTEPNPPSGWAMEQWLRDPWYCSGYGVDNCLAVTVRNIRTDRFYVQITKYWYPRALGGHAATVTVSAGGVQGQVTCSGAQTSENCGTVTLQGVSGPPITVIETPPPGWTIVSGVGTWDGNGSPPQGWSCSGNRCQVTIVNSSGERPLYVGKSWYPTAPPVGTTVTITVSASGPNGESFAQSVQCTVQQGEWTSCQPSALYLPAWVTTFTVTETGLPDG